MNKQDFRKHCEEQIERCIKLNDAKHLQEHELALGLLNENERLIQQKNEYKEVIDKAIKYIEQHTITVTDGTITTNKHELLEILKEVE
jgi:hypothetical protein